MAYEDPEIRYIESLIESANSTNSKENARQDLIHALNAAEAIGHKDLIALIKDKLRSL